ncbi:DUF4913 domain-containing protein [Streptacidiphilus griseoplanus]|uniref:DUF4913 domain-containing protein n=1 Tax=Peterkaempfera griseoplana TaxID=66896 RepID=UPI0006E15F02|nr:DUF4913 domain-containing protein [Peterkaempfera griseoplana]
MPPSWEELAATYERLAERTGQHSDLAEQLLTLIGDGTAATAGQEAQSLSILAMDEAAYADELALMTPWVDLILMDVYGREVTTGRPWCTRWPEHPEAVARLHACWLAWQQLTAPEAGPAGPSTWQRDHLEALLLHLRSPDGPFAACTQAHHRVLDTPAHTDPEALPTANRTGTASRSSARNRA